MKDITIIGRQHDDTVIEVTIYDFSSLTIYSDYTVDVTGENEYGESGTYHFEFIFLPTLDIFDYEVKNDWWRNCRIKRIIQ